MQSFCLRIKKAFVLLVTSARCLCICVNSMFATSPGRNSAAACRWAALLNLGVFYSSALSVTFTLQSKKTLENLKFEVDNNMKREIMSSGPGRRCLVSLRLHPLEEVKGTSHNREKRLNKAHRCPANAVPVRCLGDRWENEEIGGEDIKKCCCKQA